jgi:arylsulfatase A-like enzyme
MQNRISRRRIVYVCALLLPVAAVLWWAQRDAGAPGLPEASQRRDVPVIIYLVDTLRADRLGLYGYDRSTSARIDGLASDSVVFEQAYAPAPWTTPSVASLVTSTFVCEHQMTQRKKLAPELQTLAERLNSVGYGTGAFIANPLAGDLTGLNRGYAEYILREELDEPTRLADVTRFLDGVADNPFLLYLHTMEPHEPHTIPPRFVARFGQFSTDQLTDYHEAMLRYYGYRHADWKLGKPLGTNDYTAEQDAAMAYFVNLGDTVNLVYDAAVLHASANLGNIVGMLKERKLWDQAIFIFLSDHGEELGEHGGWFHGQSLYEELARVPLLMHFPGGEFGGRRITAPVSLVDLMPTVFDYLGRAELCDGCRGVSLLPLIRGLVQLPRKQPNILSMRFNRVNYYRPWKESRGDVNVLLRQGQWKGIWNAELAALELYDLHLDDREFSDLSAEQPQLAESMRQRAESWLQTCFGQATQPGEVEEIDAETEERLRALGYFN